MRRTRLSLRQPFIMRMSYRCFVLLLGVLGVADSARNPVTGAREFVMMTEALGDRAGA